MSLTLMLTYPFMQRALIASAPRCWGSPWY